MHDLLNDLRSSIRVLRRRPVFTLVAVTVLALGLSSSVAVFTYVNAFSQPFPGVDGDGLVQLFGVDEADPYRNISYLDFLDYAAEADRAFDGIAASSPYYAASVRRETMTEVAFLEAVSGDYFTVLGIETGVGRGLESTDDVKGAAYAAVISHAWWQRSFDGDPTVIGSTLFLNFEQFTIVGVASPEFVGVTSDFRPDVWIPFAPFGDRYLSWTNRSENRDVPLVRVYGRLRQDTGRERGLAELETLAAGLDEVYPGREEPRRLRLDAATWIDPRARLEEGSTVRLMMMAAGALLVLVCANVANLLLAVATGRSREIALRAAIGASPARLVRQTLVENVVLSSIAGIVAVLLAAPASARLGSYFARPSVWGVNVSRVTTIDAHVIIFALVASVVTGLVAGLLPALRASRRDLVDTLKTDAAKSTRGPRRILGHRAPGAHDTLVAMQVALSVVLLVVAGLVIRTLATVTDRDPGFAYETMISGQISTSSTEVASEDRERFQRELAAAVASEPWVRSATIAQNALLSPHPTPDLRVEGHEDPVSIVISRVIPGFFENLEIPLLHGRSFASGDTTGSPDVAIVNESLVRRFFGDAVSVGRRIWLPAADGTERRFEIVGVSRDVISRDFLAEPEPMVYFSYPQHSYGTSSSLLVSTAIDPVTATPMLARWLRDYETYLAIVNVLPYRDVVRGFVYTQRMNAELFSLLAFLGLGLAAVGIFSVMSLSVSLRTREVGIRMAVGARRGEIGWMIVRQAMVPVAAGLVMGLAASFAVTGLVQNLLFGVEPTDPLTMLGGASVLVAAALAACYLPSRRAATVDPVVALRAEG